MAIIAFGPVFRFLLHGSAAFLLTMGFAACSRVAPYDRPVQADSLMALMMWRARLGDELKPREWQLFDQALEELKFKIMTDKEASGSEAVTAALLARIDGRPLREVVHSGLQRRLDRLSNERATYDQVIALDIWIRKKRGEDTSPEHLDDLQRHARRLKKMEESIEAAKQAVADWERFAGKSPAVARGPDPESRPAQYPTWQSRCVLHRCSHVC